MNMTCSPIFKTIEEFSVVIEIITGEKLINSFMKEAFII